MAQGESNVLPLCGWSETPQHILTKNWLSENLPQKALRCRHRTLKSTAFRGQKTAPQQPSNTPYRGGSADMWPGCSEQVCSAGSSQQELGREKAGKLSHGLYHGHPSQPGMRASLSSLLLTINSSPVREDSRARRRA